MYISVKRREGNKERELKKRNHEKEIVVKVWEGEKVGSERERNKSEEGEFSGTDIIKRKLVKVEDMEGVDSKREGEKNKGKKEC